MHKNSARGSALEPQQLWVILMFGVINILALYYKGFKCISEEVSSSLRNPECLLSALRLLIVQYSRY